MKQKKETEETKYIKRIGTLAEAAYLFLMGYKLDGKESDGYKVYLLFVDSEHQIEKGILNFYNGAKVPAKAYSDAFKTVRDYAFED